MRTFFDTAFGFDEEYDDHRPNVIQPRRKHGGDLSSAAAAKVAQLQRRSGSSHRKDRSMSNHRKDRSHSTQESSRESSHVVRSRSRSSHHTASNAGRNSRHSANGTPTFRTHTSSAAGLSRNSGTDRSSTRMTKLSTSVTDRSKRRRSGKDFARDSKTVTTDTASTSSGSSSGSDSYSTSSSFETTDTETVSGSEEDRLTEQGEIIRASDMSDYDELYQMDSREEENFQKFVDKADRKFDKKQGFLKLWGLSNDVAEENEDDLASCISDEINEEQQEEEEEQEARKKGEHGLFAEWQKTKGKRHLPNSSQMVMQNFLCADDQPSVSSYGGLRDGEVLIPEHLLRLAPQNTIDPASSISASSAGSHGNKEETIKTSKLGQKQELRQVPSFLATHFSSLFCHPMEMEDSDKSTSHRGKKSLLRTLHSRKSHSKKSHSRKPFDEDDSTDASLNKYIDDDEEHDGIDDDSSESSESSSESHTVNSATLNGYDDEEYRSHYSTGTERSKLILGDNVDVEEVKQVSVQDGGKAFLVCLKNQCRLRENDRGRVLPSSKKTSKSKDQEIAVMMSMEDANGEIRKSRTLVVGESVEDYLEYLATSTEDQRSTIASSFYNDPIYRKSEVKQFIKQTRTGKKYIFTLMPNDGNGHSGHCKVLYDPNRSPSKSESDGRPPKESFDSIKEMRKVDSPVRESFDSTMEIKNDVFEDFGEIIRREASQRRRDERFFEEASTRNSHNLMINTSQTWEKRSDPDKEKAATANSGFKNPMSRIVEDSVENQEHSGGSHMRNAAKVAATAISSLKNPMSRIMEDAIQSEQIKKRAEETRGGSGTRQVVNTAAASTSSYTNGRNRIMLNPIEKDHQVTAPAKETRDDSDTRNEEKNSAQKPVKNSTKKPEGRSKGRVLSLKGPPSSPRVLSLNYPTSTPVSTTTSLPPKPSNELKLKFVKRSVNKPPTGPSGPRKRIMLFGNKDSTESQTTTSELKTTTSTNSDYTLSIVKKSGNKPAVKPAVKLEVKPAVKKPVDIPSDDEVPSDEDTTKRPKHPTKEEKQDEKECIQNDDVVYGESGKIGKNKKLDGDHASLSNKKSTAGEEVEEVSNPCTKVELQEAKESGSVATEGDSLNKKSAKPYTDDETQKQEESIKETETVSGEGSPSLDQKSRVGEDASSGLDKKATTEADTAAKPSRDYTLSEKEKGISKNENVSSKQSTPAKPRTNALLAAYSSIRPKSRSNPLYTAYTGSRKRPEKKILAAVPESETASCPPKSSEKNDIPQGPPSKNDPIPKTPHGYVAPNDDAHTKVDAASTTIDDCSSSKMATTEDDAVITDEDDDVSVQSQDSHLSASSHMPSAGVRISLERVDSLVSEADTIQEEDPTLRKHSLDYLKECTKKNDCLLDGGDIISQRVRDEHTFDESSYHKTPRDTMEEDGGISELPVCDGRDDCESMNQLKPASALSSSTTTSAIHTKDSCEEESRDKAEYTAQVSEQPESVDLPQDSSLLCDSEVDRWDRLLSTIKEIENEGGAVLNSPSSSDSSTPTYDFRSTHYRYVASSQSSDEEFHSFRLHDVEERLQHLGISSSESNEFYDASYH